MVEIARQRGLTTQERGEVLLGTWMDKYVADGANDLERLGRLESFANRLIERSERVKTRTQGIPLSRVPHRWGIISGCITGLIW